MTDLSAFWFSSPDYILIKLMSIPGMVLFFSFRGFFQAWVAKKLGDRTPEQDGFLTMNPLAHINIIGFIMLILVGFGFGKPLRFDSRYYKNKKRDGAIQVLSAPAAGLIVSFALYTVYFILAVIGTKLSISGSVYPVLCNIFLYGFQVSLMLTVFHLLPLPGFDTYRLIVIFLPYNAYRKLYKIEKYSLWIYIGFISLLRVPVIGDVVTKYLLDVPFNALAWLLTRPFSLIGRFI